MLIITGSIETSTAAGGGVAAGGAGGAALPEPLEAMPVLVAAQMTSAAASCCCQGPDPCVCFRNQPGKIKPASPLSLRWSHSTGFGGGI